MLGAGSAGAQRGGEGLKANPGSRPRSARLAGGHRLPEEGRGSPTWKAWFHVVGYGCTTCIGNSGPLPEEVSRGIAEGDLVVASVLSGNRNFEGRVTPR